jgi:ribosome biogenesis GTPase A
MCCCPQVSGFQVAAQPPIYVLDTPGVMMPAVPSDEVGFKLALAGAQLCWLA